MLFRNNTVLSRETGKIVCLRSRQYLVEDVVSSQGTGDTQVTLSCLEDDAQGQSLEVFWERELNAQILGNASWELVAKRGFDNPRQFSAATYPSAPAAIPNPPHKAWSVSSKIFLPGKIQHRSDLAKSV